MHYITPYQKNIFSYTIPLTKAPGCVKVNSENKKGQAKNAKGRHIKKILSLPQNY
jgi:hypothetical protein